MTSCASLLCQILSRVLRGPTPMETGKTKMDGWHIPLVALLFILIASVFFRYQPHSSEAVATWVQAFGSIGAILAAIWIMQRQSKKARDDDEAETRAFVQAIREELGTFWEGYNLNIRVNLKEVRVGGYLNAVSPASPDVFTIYNASSSRVGKVPDAELRRLIVAVYARFKGQIYSLQANNNLVMEQRSLDVAGYGLEHAPREIAERSDRHKRVLVDYTEQLKASDEQLEKHVDKLFRRADAWLGVQKNDAADMP